MKKLFAGTVLTVLSAMSLPMSSVAQDKFEASVGADLVSNYIWRGQDLGSASIQPALSLSYKGISFSAWGLCRPELERYPRSRSDFGIFHSRFQRFGD